MNLKTIAHQVSTQCPLADDVKYFVCNRIWKKINLKVCRNFGDTCQRLQVNKFIALLSLRRNQKWRCSSNLRWFSFVFSSTAITLFKKILQMTYQLFTCSIVNPVSWANCFFWSSEGYGCYKYEKKKKQIFFSKLKLVLCNNLHRIDMSHGSLIRNANICIEHVLCIVIVKKCWIKKTFMG